ncbi:ArsR/SmtB family transcription factor [Pseudobacteriovorax antillogorgiicola]|uniref:Transcriptional regulator, ArsR family n=1 Tax=Pseudobacteriovorax antillogorgiicola TaxID=1513793 RepID=A0A1Y6BXG4_9BACT|nr:metalloregulator ArsR/SmtB family transcription factor [Pseudobacteriovorax antillogorgiicola]TCS53098.1 ArsR family transcriptional regulator [Pseudobacteriovorax antillogorgiicola]SMF25901.1 transcriptional regulator, ArsR family [Pseudobacteriovorax antillogorgiicola]
MGKFEELDERMASLCKALAHPARVRILSFLIERRECISGDLAEHIPLAASTISEHLRILKSVGLVQGTVDGPRRCYCVDGEVLKEWQDLVCDLQAPSNRNLSC